MADQHEQLGVDELLDERSFGEWVEAQPGGPRLPEGDDVTAPSAPGVIAGAGDASPSGSGEPGTALALPPLLIDIRTGEALEPTPENAAVLLYALKQHKRQAIEAIKLCEQILHAEARRQGTKTLHLPGGQVEVRTPTELVWNLELLEELRTLGLPEERWNDLVRETVERKVDARIAKQIAASNEAYAKVIDAARQTHDKPPYVLIK